MSWQTLPKDEIHNSYYPYVIIKVVKVKRIRRAGNIYRLW
jgi:hypothetical protein